MINGQGSYEQSSYEQGSQEEATEPDSHEILNPKSFLTGQKSNNDSTSGTDSNDEINDLNSNEFQPNTDEPVNNPKESPYEPIPDPNGEPATNEGLTDSQKDENTTIPSSVKETNNQLTSGPYLNPPYSTEYNNENLPIYNLYNNQPVYRELVQLYPLVPIQHEKSYASFNHDYQQPYYPQLYQEQMFYNQQQQHLLNQQANNFRSFFNPLQTITYEPIEDKTEKDNQLKSKI